MRFDVITLFPELIEPHLRVGVTQRAFSSGQVGVKLWQLRDFGEGNYRRVDERPYGGGPGMVLMAGPLLRAVAAARADRSEPSAEVILFSPSGQTLTQSLVAELASGPGAVLVCGRYEGVDQRFIDTRVARQVSLGDFVLSGGEIPALALLDGVARLQRGVLSEGSAESESFSDGLLEGPCWTRPEVMEIDEADFRVPTVMTQGHHELMSRHRRRSALIATARRRPDLILAARAKGKLSQEDEAVLTQEKLQS